MIRAAAGGVEFVIVPQGAIALRTWANPSFERAEIEFILRMLQPGMTFFDAGANIGLFSLAIGRKLMGQASTIYAFEPCPSTFSILKKNLSENRLAEVRAVRLALSDQTGETTLYAKTGLKDALNSPGSPSRTDAEVVGQELVQTITLDDFVARERIPRVDVMKVGVEGAELLVFRGGRKLLAGPDAPLILYAGYGCSTAEFHYHPVELMWQLEEFGYEFFILHPDLGCLRRRMPGQCYDAMVAAVKRTHPAYTELARGESKA
ncbi:MAG TPA: FkbM family methyltransferase [Candidatus Acidoferrum sp.]|nr:FkbM family methyltransferase [Candidatus Acidoferrum sp.]